jgi:hypothetical protein
MTGRKFKSALLSISLYRDCHGSGGRSMSCYIAGRGEMKEMEADAKGGIYRELRQYSSEDSLE